MCWWTICSVLTGTDVGTGIEMSRLNCTVRTGTFNCMKAVTQPEQKSQSPVPTLIDGSALSFYLFFSSTWVRFSSNEWLSKIVIFKETATDMEINKSHAISWFHQRARTASSQMTNF